MGQPPDFIGLGAQRAGTSWIYACLYEHPDIYAPIKEVHFFSREAAWSRGYEWYESTFRKRPSDAKAGELSTSYLSSPETPARIRDRYPDVKLFVSFRNPVDRAYSNYLNDLVAGRVNQGTDFGEALSEHSEYVYQGLYATHLARFLELFRSDQVLAMVYEDSLTDPVEFVQKIYRFLGVDPSFVPSMAHSQVNAGRVPRFPTWDRLARKASISLRTMRMHRLWWAIKRAGGGDLVRGLNTRRSDAGRGPSRSESHRLYKTFESEILGLEQLLERDFKGWRY